MAGKIQADEEVGPSVRVRELLEPPCSLISVLDLPSGLERSMSSVVTTDLPDPSRYLTGGELVVTGLMWRTGAEDTERFVAAVAGCGASALAAGDTRDDELPRDLVESCRHHRLPLLRVPGDLAFATLTEHVVRRISGQRASDLGTMLERHRRLVAAPGPAEALGAVLELISADLGLDCWVIDAAGELVASAGRELDAGERTWAAQAALKEAILPAIVARGADTKRSVYAVDDGDRLTGWYLVLDGDRRRWDPQREAVVGQAAAVLGAERERLAERTAGRRAEASRLVRDAAAGENGEVLAARLREFGLGDGERLRVLAVAQRGAGRDGQGAEPVRLLAESALATRPGVPAMLPAVAAYDEDFGTGLPAHALVVAVESETEGAQTRLRRWLELVSPGLGGRSIGVGVSAPADPGQLKRAVDDARHALRVAAARPGAVTFVSEREIASHALLLASVPADVSAAYRDRLLGPILAYDAAHKSELEATLEAYLRASGSWTRCAAAMHLHVNTLKYRVSRIEELIGRPVSQLETQTDLLLALDLR